MIVYDMVMNVLDTKWFPQHDIAGLISGITFIVLFQSGKASTVGGNKHTHRNAAIEAPLVIIVRVIKPVLSTFVVILDCFIFFANFSSTSILSSKYASFSVNYFERYDTCVVFVVLQGLDLGRFYSFRYRRCSCVLFHSCS